jgi:hypothetical protein
MTIEQYLSQWDFGTRKSWQFRTISHDSEQQKTSSIKDFVFHKSITIDELKGILGHYVSLQVHCKERCFWQLGKPHEMVLVEEETKKQFNLLLGNYVVICHLS